MYKLLLLILFSITLLSNCSLSNNRTDTFKVSVLNMIQKKFTPSISWSTSIGDGIGDYYSNLHPAYSNGIIYAADRKGIVNGVNINNGKKIWTVDLAKKNEWFSQNSALLSGGITISNNYIYIGSEKAQVYALDSKDGSMIWQVTVAGEVLSSPVANRGIILIRTSNGQLQALHETNGTIKWTINLGIPVFSLRGNSSPAINFDIIVVGNDAGLVRAISAQDGQIIWQQHISRAIGHTEIDCLKDISASPVIIGNIVYVTSYNGNFTALDLFSGQIIWERNIGSINNFIVCNNRIYVSDQNDVIMAINAKNGMTLWTQNNLIHRQLTAPVLYKGNLVISDNKGYIYWLDPKDGHFFAWKKINNSGFLADPIIADDKLLIQSKNGILYAIIN